MKRVENVGVREGYDRWAAVYDTDGNPLVALDDSVVPRVLGDVRARDVLDLGCGTGRHTARLARDGARVTALDFSPGMLARAKERVTSAPVRWVQADLTERFPFDDDAFDVVLSCLALEHVRDLEPVFVEARRVLRPSGLLVVSDMHPWMRHRGTQANFDDESGVEVRLDGHLHPISEYVMASLRAGFELEELEEHAADAALAERLPRAAKYVGWPMLVVLRARAHRCE